MLEEYDVFLEGIALKCEKSWRELYRYYYAPLCVYSGKLIGDNDAAKDIVQGCFVRLWNQPVYFADIKAITAYMYRSVYHGSLNYIRDKQTSGQIHRHWMDENSVDEEESMRMALEEESITRFYIVLSELPEQQRKIILLSMQGDKVKEIAEKFSVSENTIKTQKKRAYMTIKQKIGDGWVIVFPLLFPIS